MADDCISEYQCYIAPGVTILEIFPCVWRHDSHVGILAVSFTGLHGLSGSEEENKRSNGRHI